MSSKISPSRKYEPNARDISIVFLPTQPSPARRATLTTAPDRVQLWFNEAIEPKFSSASVWDSAGQQVDLGDARIEPDDPKRLTIGLKPLARGAYRVRFRVLSVDGHVVESEFPFTLR